VSVQLSDGVAPVEDRVFRLGIVATGRHAGRIAIGASPLFHNRVKEIPGALYSKLDGCWTVPKAWPAVLTIGEVARGLKVGIRPSAELAAWVAEHKDGWEVLRALSADLGGGKAMPAAGELYGHQKAGSRWLVGPSGDGRFPTAGRLLLDDTGTGKTITVIEALKSLSTWPVLITCPKSVIRTGWQAAFETWLPDARVVVADGSAAKRRKAIDMVQADEADVLLIGHESFRTHTRFSAFPGQALRRCMAHGGPKTGEDVVPDTKCQAHPRELNEIDWQVIICDEIHKAINPKAQLTQALWGLVDGEPRALRWGLTGTLISKRTDQAWAPLRFADHEAWPVKSSWTDYYLEQGFDQYGFWQVIGLKPDRKDEFVATFDGVTRRVLKDQVLDLPPVLRGGSLVREVTLGREQRAVYDDMRTKMIAWVDEGKIIAGNALVQAGRMTLLASATGYPITDDDGGISEMGLKLPSAKIAQFLEDLDDELFGDSQVGLLFESRKFLRLTEQAMLDHGVAEDSIGVIAGDVQSLDKRSEVIESFQAGRKRFVLLTYAAGGVGITLTAADQVVLLQRSWSPILMRQGLDRFIRIGAEKHKSITVFDYLAADTIEQRQLDRLGRDAATYEDLVRDKDRLRDLFSR
jgi:superfamily II DNA or RNA helicase